MNPGGNDRWHAVQASAYAHEQEALDVLKRALPPVPPFRAWSNFEFIAQDGSINEVDALVLSSDRIYLIEIKSWGGRITGNQHTWLVGSQGRPEENPLLLANRKAKKLKSLLAQTRPFKSYRVPYIQAAVFLSSPHCTIALDEVAATHVYVRPGGKGRPNVADLISGSLFKAEGRPTIGRELERALGRAFDEIGLRPPSSSARVADYKLLQLIYENDRYQDWMAVHSRLEADRRHVRIFPHRENAAQEDKKERKDLALREYRLMNPVHHEGILRPLQLTECEVGPALIYDLYPNAIRLDHFMESGLSSLDLGQRLELVRSIAEGLQYAHKHGIQHRALSPWTIDVVTETDGTLRPMIRDWQAASAGGDGKTSTTRMTLHVGTHAGLLVDERAQVYMAPEAFVGAGQDDGTALDVFALGALTYALFSGKHPAESPEELLAQCRTGPGLRLSSVRDGVPDALEELVQEATDVRPADRPADVREFLQLLDGVEDKLTEPKAGVDPRDARKGDVLTGGYMVVQRLGSGSSAFALSVEKDGQRGVLKIAKDPSLNERIRDEASVLKDFVAQTGHPNIIHYYGLFEIDGLAALFVEQAGDRTLGQRLRTEGPISVDWLERFGDELLSALITLEREGINHRDIKPENIGITQSRTGRPTLKLFDFSLSKTPTDNIRAGTPPYLDPFLRDRKPPRWDLWAERYAAAVTLYEMVTGKTPTWDSEDPADSESEAQLDTSLFDAALRDSLERFFSRAFKPHYKYRFDNAQDMQQAWRAIFQAERPKTTDTQDGGDEIDWGKIEHLSRATRLLALGLSPRVLNAAERLGATTAGDLIRLPGIPGKGIGQQVTRRLRRLRDELEDRLPVEPTAGVSLEPSDQASLDRLAQWLMGIKLTETDSAALATWLGLQGPVPGSDLPTLREAAEARAISRRGLQATIDQAVEKWSKNAWMTVLRDEVASFLGRREGIVTLDELRERLLAARRTLALHEAPSS